MVASGAAVAQQQRELRSDPDAPIVVTGQRIGRAQARERAVSFIRQIGVARGETPAARWVVPVCPRVLGISAPYAEIVAERMRAIATEAGIRVGRQGCRTNISVSFVGDASQLMQDIDRQSPTRLQQVPRELRDDLLNGDAPIRWWYLTETQSRHGMRNAPQSLATEAGGGASAGGSQQSSGALDVNALSQYNSSMISTQGNRVLLDAAVVIDLDRAEGQTLQSVAAYAAFVAFAEVRPSEPPPAGSILDLFTSEGEMRGLTDWDMAFLQALYEMPLDRPARRHRGTLVREMVNFQTDE